MNIFLLFISMFIMIGYYIMSSPSQNVVQQETEYVIQQSDTRSIAECVVATQNAVMYCGTFTDECVARYGITSSYVFLNPSGSVTSHGSMADLCANTGLDGVDTPDRIFIITTSYVLPPEERSSMLDILEKYYSDRGTLGIIQNPELIVSDSVVARQIPANVISNADLQDGQLAYIMQYRTPEIPWDEPGGEDPDNPECPPGTIAVNRFGRWHCVPLDPVIYCQSDTVWNPETLECEPTENFTCESENATLVKIDDTWVCLEPENEVDCGNGVLMLNANTLTWECTQVDNPEQVLENCNASANKPSYIFSYSDVKTTGLTLKVKTVSCGRCEKPAIDKDTCEVYCLPDVKKMNTRTCFAGDPSCCTGSDKGIYFGFAPNSRTDGLTDESGNPLNIDLKDILDEYHERNRKFNCMHCKYSTKDTANSHEPYTTICTGTQGGENVKLVPGTDGACEAREFDDDDGDWTSVSMLPVNKEEEKDKEQGTPSEMALVGDKTDTPKEKTDEEQKKQQEEQEKIAEQKKQEEEKKEEEQEKGSGSSSAILKPKKKP